MANLKTWVLGAGLGLAGLVPIEAEGQDYTINDFIRVNDSNFQTEIINASYEKPVVVLFDSSCPVDKSVIKGRDNLHNVLVDEMEVFDSKVKFTRFDRCGLGINDSDYLNFEKKYGDGTAIIATAIYFQGNVFFRLKGSFKDHSNYQSWFDGFSKRLTALTQE